MMPLINIPLQRLLRSAFLAALIFGAIGSKAQSIVRFEYFIDTDPGVGLATATSPSAAATITDFAISIPTTTLAPGYHEVFVRAENTSGLWTQTMFYPFFIVATPIMPAGTISQVEYFIDTDPGTGLGQQVTGFSPAAALTNLAIALNTSSLSKGFHSIYVRVKNEKGLWSETSYSQFYITPPLVVTNLVKFEYFFDTDPGFDKAAAVAVSPPSLSVANQNIIAVPSSLAVGSHTINVRAKDAAGDWTEVVSATFDVTEFSCLTPAPGVDPATGCANSAIALTASGATETQQYRWYDVPTGGTSLSSAAVYSPVLTMTTTYYVSIFDVAQNCEGTRASVTATVTPAPPQPSVTAEGALNFCSGQSVTLLGPSGFSSYLWSDGSTSPTRTVSASSSLTLQVKDATGCQSASSEQTVVMVYPTPEKPAITGSTDICNGKAAVLAGPNGFTYIWSDGETTQQISVADEVTITLKITDENECSSTSDPLLVSCSDIAPIIQSATVTTYIEGEVSLSLLPLISDPDNNLDRSTITVSATRSGAPATLDENYLLTIDYKGNTFTGTDSLTVSACDEDARCTERAILIEVAGAITVYQGFSPNGDNTNEVFYIKYIDVLPDTQHNKVTIFNRWGDIVFDVSNYNNTSNVFRGMNNSGDRLPTGTYYYKIDFADGKKEMTGFLSLKN